MWKRFIIYEGIVSYNFLLNIGLFIANKEFLNNFIPDDIERTLFFLSLGLYIGFQICKHESKRVWEINKKLNKQDDNNLTDN
jgi:hypothetical protein